MPMMHSDGLSQCGQTLNKHPYPVVILQPRTWLLFEPDDFDCLRYCQCCLQFPHLTAQSRVDLVAGLLCIGWECIHLTVRSRVDLLAGLLRSGREHFHLTVPQFVRLIGFVALHMVRAGFLLHAPAPLDRFGYIENCICYFINKSTSFLFHTYAINVSFGPHFVKHLKEVLDLIRSSIDLLRFYIFCVPNFNYCMSCLYCRFSSWANHSEIKIRAELQRFKLRWKLRIVGKFFYSSP